MENMFSQVKYMLGKYRKEHNQRKEGLSSFTYLLIFSDLMVQAGKSSQLCSAP